MTQFRVLLVDDENDLIDTLREELSYKGWLTDLANDGLMGLEIFKQKKFDIVISDVRMPKADGIQLLTAVRAIDRKVPFVLMSAFADIPFWEGYALGANAFVGKPFRIDILLDLLERLKIPLEQQWMDRENIWKGAKPIQHIVMDGKVNTEIFSLGRGGMFINPGSNSLLKGQLLSFLITTPRFVLEGIGKVLWRRGGGTKGLGPGLGVEFLYLKEPGRSLIAGIIEQSSEKAYIPRGEMRAVDQACS